MFRPICPRKMQWLFYSPRFRYHGSSRSSVSARAPWPGDAPASCTGSWSRTLEWLDFPGFMDEKSALKLAFATLWRVSQDWSSVRFSEHEYHQLARLIKWVRSTEDGQQDDGEEALTRGA